MKHADSESHCFSVRILKGFYLKSHLLLNKRHKNVHFLEHIFILLPQRFLCKGKMLTFAFDLFLISEKHDQ